MKKIGLIILGSFMLLSSTALSCPDKNFHNTMVYVMESLGSVIYIKTDTMYIDSKKLAVRLMNEYPNDKEEQLDFVKVLLTNLWTYCQNHGLKLEESYLEK
ncbi:hypothetical protein [Fusobacterium ulcerans]|uniref:hypothetical protein n=1 Tax=Fusobacterium ulcerans TaxID=861 RepID=UPI003FF07353